MTIANVKDPEYAPCLLRGDEEMSQNFMAQSGIEKNPLLHTPFSSP